MSDLEDFARGHDLAVERDKILGERSRCVLGRNGSVMETDTPGRLLVTIICLSGLERLKLEFRLVYHHIRVLPEMCSEGALCAEFSADNERQAHVVIELARLRERNTYDPTHSRA